MKKWFLGGNQISGVRVEVLGVLGYPVVINLENENGTLEQVPPETKF